MSGGNGGWPDAGDAVVKLDHPEGRVREGRLLMFAAVEAREGPAGGDEGGAKLEDAVDWDENVEVREGARAGQTDAEESDSASLEDDERNLPARGVTGDLP